MLLKEILNYDRPYDKLLRFRSRSTNRLRNLIDYYKVRNKAKKCVGDF